MTGHERAYYEYSDMLERTSNRKASMETLAKKVAEKAGFDISTILIIFEAIATALKSIMEKCDQPIPPAMEAVKLADGWAMTMATARGLRENDIRPLSREGRRLREVIPAEIKASDEPTANLLMAMCK